ncbi:PREDICTED: hepatocyte nuclear factor 6-like [Branchiostoma belcheri]|uniref:Hepatocyte nuclear factor 6-like n=1 Tax=Branchiostoma belcheri TaxID=7741 RepID=A0A6P5A8U3_BRABE|nr:PREDICTED: hepatocyte nuclear factor 6-like [Branchiostoma belcheri]
MGGRRAGFSPQLRTVLGHKSTFCLSLFPRFAACQRKAYQDHGRPAAANSACKRKEQEAAKPPEQKGPKKPRLVFTDLQRRTLHAIFKENKRPSKEMQAQIAKQLGLDLSTVCNFFMNARRRSQDKWQEDEGKSAGSSSNGSTPTSCTK